MISDFIIAALIVIAPLSIVFWKFKRDKGAAEHLRQQKQMEVFLLSVARHHSSINARGGHLDAQQRTNEFFNRQVRVDDRIREKVRQQSKPARPVTKPAIDNRRRVLSSDRSSSRVSDDPISSWVDSTPSSSPSDFYSGGGGDFSGGGASGGWASGSSSSDSSSSSSSD